MEIVRETDSQFDAVLLHQFLYLPGRMYDVLYREIFTGIQAFYHLLAIGKGRRDEHGRLHIANLGGDGEAEQDNLYNGHTDQDQHRTPVAQDVIEFFPDKCNKLFHDAVI
jgi:hypothetical protein